VSKVKVTKPTSKPTSRKEFLDNCKLFTKQRVRRLQDSVEKEMGDASLQQKKTFRVSVEFHADTVIEEVVRIYIDVEWTIKKVIKKDIPYLEFS